MLDIGTKGTLGGRRYVVREKHEHPARKSELSRRNPFRDKKDMNMRYVALLALLAVATAIPTMNIPGDKNPSTVHVAEDTMHAEFVVWKAKVRSLLEFVLIGRATWQP